MITIKDICLSTHDILLFAVEKMHPNSEIIVSINIHNLVMETFGVDIIYWY